MNMIIQKIWTFIPPILIILSIGYGKLCIVVYLFQSKLIYIPTQSLMHTPGAFNFNYHDGFLISGDTNINGLKNFITNLNSGE